MTQPTPTLGDRSLFPALDAKVYLSHAAVSPPSTAVNDACAAVLADYGRLGMGAWTRYRDQRDELHGDLAALIGAAPADIALVPSTTQGVIDIALCFTWEQGDRVVLYDGEFPTNVTPWQQAATHHGLDVVYGAVSDYAASDDQGLDRLEQLLRGGARLVAVSAVQFQSGLAMPLAAMAELCHRHGAELFVDGMQAVGGMPVDVAALGVDYLACGSHKWLMGLEGAGFVYVHPDRVDALRPLVAGWLSHEDAATFLFDGAGHLKYDRPIRRRADFLEVGAMPTIGFAALGAAVKLLRQLGVAAIWEHNNAILDDLEAGFCELGFTSLRASAAARRSSILGLCAPAARTVDEVRQGLDDRGIACTMPDGVLRLAPHWPNDRAQVEVVLAAARELM